MGIQLDREENSQGLEYDLKVKMSNLIEIINWVLLSMHPPIDCF